MGVRNVGGAVLGLLIVVGTAIAQEPAVKDAAKPARVNDATRRVPPYFAQLGLKPEQKEAIYKIRGKHQAEIDALKKQIARLQADEIAACEAVLTDAQKQLLGEKRAAAAKAKVKKASD